jgi:hypothetical protein
LTYNVAEDLEMENYGSAPGVFDKQYNYNKADCAVVEVPIATVHIKLEQSLGNCLLVPLLFKTPSGDLFPATVLVDTRAMANFVNEGFIWKHALQL